MTFMDGDTFITKERMIFQAFGYLHPPERATVYLKYVPINLKSLIPLEYEETKWNYQTTTLLRPRNLYTPYNLDILRKVFQKHFPQYLFYDAYSGKTLLSLSYSRIEQVIKPKEALKAIMEKGSPDQVEEKTIKLVKMLSKTSGIAVQHFGLHGSLALGIHQSFSDIDLTVHGGKNFREILKAVKLLASNGTFQLLTSESADAFRLNKGVFEKWKFVVNAIRTPEEINETYGEYCYIPMGHVAFTARVTNDLESDYKPAIYYISEYQDQKRTKTMEEKPTQVVSMISLYRGLVRRGQQMKGEGQLEAVEQTGGTHSFTRVVIGTGLPDQEEYLWPISL